MHYESVKKKQAFNKRAKRAAKLGLLCNQYPFKMKRDGDLLKILSYYNDVVVPETKIYRTIDARLFLI